MHTASGHSHYIIHIMTSPPISWNGVQREISSHFSFFFFQHIFSPQTSASQKIVFYTCKKRKKDKENEGKYREKNDFSFCKIGPKPNRQGNAKHK